MGFMQPTFHRSWDNKAVMMMMMMSKGDGMKDGNKSKTRLGSSHVF